MAGGDRNVVPEAEKEGVEEGGTGSVFHAS